MIWISSLEDDLLKSFAPDTILPSPLDDEDVLESESESLGDLALGSLDGVGLRIWDKK